MKIISKWRVNQKPLTDDMVKKDLPEIKRINKEATEEHPTWGMFGGVISIGDRRYQVVND